VFLHANLAKTALTEKLRGRADEVASHTSCFDKSLQRSDWPLSFFDDGEETAPRPAAQVPRAPQPPQPRRPQHAAGTHGEDQHAVVVRRRVAAGLALVLVIVIVLLINGCLSSQKTDALKEYNRSVGQISSESDQKVARPLFSELTGASAKPAIDVSVQLNQLHLEALQQASRAKGLSVPSEMDAAQRNLLLALDLRAEAVAKIASLMRTAMAGQTKQASTLIAGDMENFLASDVIHSQRVRPLIEQTLRSNGIHGVSVASSQFLPNIGWLEPSMVEARITGHASSGAQNGQVAPGTHGTALSGVSVGETTLESEPALNHISGGSAPTFTAAVENTGEDTETNVKVSVTVTAQGKQLKATRSINSMQAGTKTNVDIPVENVPTGVGAKVEVYVEPVPGETETENNKGTFLAMFGS
jgi:hypothetical protein